MTDTDVDISLTTRDYELLMRCLAFTELQFPIQDALGNRLYPTQATRLHAKDLESRFEEAGIEIREGLFTPFNPHDLLNKVVTARYMADGYEHNIKGKITEIVENEDESWTISFGKIQFHYLSREEFQKNHHEHLDTPT